jgi:hypothetical protein
MDKLNNIAGNKIELGIGDTNDQILSNTSVIKAKGIAY